MSFAISGFYIALAIYIKMLYNHMVGEKNNKSKKSKLGGS